MLRILTVFAHFFGNSVHDRKNAANAARIIPHCLPERFFDDGRTLSRRLAGGRAERDGRARFYSICKAAFMPPALKMQFAKPPPQGRLRTRPIMAPLRCAAICSAPSRLPYGAQFGARQGMERILRCARSRRGTKARYRAK